MDPSIEVIPTYLFGYVLFPLNLILPVLQLQIRKLFNFAADAAMLLLSARYHPPCSLARSPKCSADIIASTDNQTNSSKKGNAVSLL